MFVCYSRVLRVSETVPRIENKVQSCISHSIRITLPRYKHSVCYCKVLITSVHPDQQDEAVCRAHKFPLSTTSPMCCLWSRDTKPHSVPQNESSLSGTEKFISVLILSLILSNDQLSSSKQWTPVSAFYNGGLWALSASLQFHSLGEHV